MRFGGRGFRDLTERERIEKKTRIWAFSELEYEGQFGQDWSDPLGNEKTCSARELHAQRQGYSLLFTWKMDPRF